MEDYSEYICLDELLYRRMSIDEPVMPALIPYFDNDFFDIYAARFNAINKIEKYNDRFELSLARSLLYETFNNTKKCEYKYLIAIINKLLY